MKKFWRDVCYVFQNWNNKRQLTFCFAVKKWKPKRMETNFERNGETKEMLMGYIKLEHKTSWIKFWGKKGTMRSFIRRTMKNLINPMQFYFQCFVFSSLALLLGVIYYLFDNFWQPNCTFSKCCVNSLLMFYFM